MTLVVISTVRPGPAGSGVRFKAGDGVGTVTRPGLPVPPGEPAINPVPRELMSAVVGELATAHGDAGDIEIEISIPGGKALAAKTWNPRLGIEGGIKTFSLELDDADDLDTDIEYDGTYISVFFRF